MPNPIQVAAAELNAALKTVPGCRVHALGDTIDPPGLVLGAPRLLWEAYAPAPTNATFPVFLVVGFSDRSLDQLWELVPAVAEAIESTEGTVAGANPGVYTGGGREFPCYTFDVEYPLTQEMGP